MIVTDMIIDKYISIENTFKVWSICIGLVLF